MIRKSLFLISICVLGLTPAWAADGQGASRPTLKQDLVGTWELVSVRPLYNKKDPVFYPYQRFVFNADSSMKFMASQKPFTKEWLDKFDRQTAEIDYSLSEKGMMVLTWQKQPHSENALCAYVLKDVPSEIAAKLSETDRKGLPKKGDVTLSFLGSQARISYQKVLRKIA